jgi:hypothetical protein
VNNWRPIAVAFRLSRPLQTVPAIDAFLATADNDQRFIAKLLLTTADAVCASLATAYRDNLRAISGEAQPP